VGLGGERVVGMRASVVKCHCGHLPAADGELVGNPMHPTCQRVKRTDTAGGVRG